MKFFGNHGVLVTGGGRGIGRAIALAFAEEGADVFITSRTESELIKVAEEINDRGSKGGYYVCDISDPRQVEIMTNEAKKFLGKVDILVNNAGIFLMSEAKDTSINEWQMVINVNLNGMFYCTHFILPGMVERQYGTIINISSMAGKKPYLKQSAYVASKFGIVGFSKTLAAELKPYNIKVHVICPGGVDTTLVRQHNFPPGSTIKPEEIADVAVFLAKQRRQITIDEIMIRRYASDPY